MIMIAAIASILQSIKTAAVLCAIISSVMLSTWPMLGWDTAVSGFSTMAVAADTLIPSPLEGATSLLNVYADPAGVAGDLAFPFLVLARSDWPNCSARAGRKFATLPPPPRNGSNASSGGADNYTYAEYVNRTFNQSGNWSGGFNSTTAPSYIWRFVCWLAEKDWIGGLAAFIAGILVSAVCKLVVFVLRIVAVVTVVHQVFYLGAFLVRVPLRCWFSGWNKSWGDIFEENKEHATWSQLAVLGVIEVALRGLQWLFAFVWWVLARFLYAFLAVPGLCIGVWGFTSATLARWEPPARSAASQEESEAYEDYLNAALISLEQDIEAQGPLMTVGECDAAERIGRRLIIRLVGAKVKVKMITDRGRRCVVAALGRGKRGVPFRPGLELAIDLAELQRLRSDGVGKKGQVVACRLALDNVVSNNTMALSLLSVGMLSLKSGEIDELSPFVWREVACEDVAAAAGPASAGDCAAGPADTELEEAQARVAAILAKRQRKTSPVVAPRGASARTSPARGTTPRVSPARVTPPRGSPPRRQDATPSAAAAHAAPARAQSPTKVQPLSAPPAQAAAGESGARNSSPRVQQTQRQPPRNGKGKKGASGGSVAGNCALVACGVWLVELCKIALEAGLRLPAELRALSVATPKDALAAASTLALALLSGRVDKPSDPTWCWPKLIKAIRQKFGIWLGGLTYILEKPDGRVVVAGATYDPAGVGHWAPFFFNAAEKHYYDRDTGMPMGRSVPRATVYMCAMQPVDVTPPFIGGSLPRNGGARQSNRMRGKCSQTLSPPEPRNAARHSATKVAMMSSVLPFLDLRTSAVVAPAAIWRETLSLTQLKIASTFSQSVAVSGRAPVISLSVCVTFPALGSSLGLSPR